MLEMPDLDTKSYQQFMNDALARIPTLCKEWTDHNPQDLGIMLLELCAAMTEGQIFYLNQVGERFLNCYMDLLLDRQEGETFQERKARFSSEYTQIKRAVTEADYQQLILSSPFGIDRATVVFSGTCVFVTVFRRSGALDEGELHRLREYLEPYRLLATRIVLHQAPCKPIRITCELQINPKICRTSLLHAQVQTLLEGLIERKIAGESLNLGKIQSELLSIPGVVKIVQLSAKGTDEALKNILKQNDFFMTLEQLEIKFMIADHPQ